MVERVDGIGDDGPSLQFHRTRKSARFEVQPGERVFSGVIQKLAAFVESSFIANSDIQRPPARRSELEVRGSTSGDKTR